jgi:hypothetical protein
MDKKSEGKASPAVAAAEPVVLPDVATSPHADGQVPQAGAGILQDALPEINEAARKVGGMKNLSDIAGQLSQAETGQ